MAFAVSQLSKVDMMAFMERQTLDVRRQLGDLIVPIALKRVAHWKSTVARLWEYKPSVEYRWQIGDTPARGSFPVLSSAVLQCTTVEEVDHAVQD